MLAITYVNHDNIDSLAHVNDAVRALQHGRRAAILHYQLTLVNSSDMCYYML